MTKECECCGKDVTKINVGGEVATTYTMYQSLDVSLGNDGIWQNTYTHKIKYICHTCRIENNAQWRQIWREKSKGGENR